MYTLDIHIYIYVYVFLFVFVIIVESIFADHDKNGRSFLYAPRSLFAAVKQRGSRGPMLQGAEGRGPQPSGLRFHEVSI